MRLELPPVHANDLRDIDVPLVFLFNSMGNENTGYGTSWQLQQAGKLFPPGYLHETWRDWLYWDIELEP